MECAETNNGNIGRREMWLNTSPHVPIEYGVWDVNSLINLTVDDIRGIADECIEIYQVMDHLEKLGKRIASLEFTSEELELMAYAITQLKCRLLHLEKESK